MWSNDPGTGICPARENATKCRRIANYPAKDIGWLLKRVLAEDERRTFVPFGHTTGNEYILA